MNFEKIFAILPNTPPESAKQESTEKSKPIVKPKKLRYILKSLEMLKPQQRENDDGTKEELRWQDLYEKIGGFEDSMDLSDKIRKAVIEWVSEKTPALKEKMPTIRNLPDNKLVYAIASNWFSELPEIEGQRRETLLAVVAGVVKRIETRIWYKKLEQAQDLDLEKLGISPSERDLLVNLLKISSKANPLFVRFLAFSRLTPEAPKKADLQKFAVPGKKGLFSLSQLFPKETRFLSNKFEELYNSSKTQEWHKKPGGEEMSDFLRIMSQIYSKDITPEAAQDFQGQIDTASDALIKSDFPIAVIPSGEGIFKEKHIDPEIKIGLKSKDCKDQEEKFEKAKMAMAECLKEKGLEKFSSNLELKHTKPLIGVGEFGVNLVFKAVAQESEGNNIIFMDEQKRSYDVNFSKYLDLIENSEKYFSGAGEEEKQAMSRMLSILHEFSHLHPENSTPAKRLGDNAESVICEAEAESIYRSYIPSIIEKQGLSGTKEQWAHAMLAASLQMLKDPESYAQSAGFTLKKALDKGAISWDGKKLNINDYDEFFEIQNESANEVLGLYNDVGMTEGKARLWIDKNCGDATIEQIINFVAEQP